MKNKFIQILSIPFFLALLPLFYFQHRLLENYAPSLFPDFLKLSILYSGILILIAGLFSLYLRNFSKASLAAIVLMAADFFYSSVQDLLANITGSSVLSKYSILLPVFFITILLIIRSIKKSTKDFSSVCRYVNLLLLILIVIDIVQVLQSKQRFQSRLKNTAIPYSQFTKCDTCSRPDIFLLVVDEYAGNQELKDIFNSDNTILDSSLNQRGFHTVKNSSSNYNSTVYSMGSFFSMNYLAGLNEKLTENYKDILFCRELINNNAFTKYLQSAMGYEIYNFSFFDFGDQRRVVQNILTTNTNILAGNTLFHKLNYTFGARLVSRKKIEKIKLTELVDNQKIETLLKESLDVDNRKPKFVYAHFNMPHWPYFFDSAGIQTPVDSLTETYKTNKKAYIQYLKYSNNKILNLIDEIKQKSKNPPVIMLISDHGFRQLPPDTDKKYYFMNLNSIFLPSGKYATFYDGMSNVNLLRAYLKHQFNQSWPMLPDSSIFIKD